MSYIKIKKILKDDVETPEKGYIYFGYEDTTVSSGSTKGFWIKDDDGSEASYILEGYSNAPIISDFDPTSAYNGDLITIYGINFVKNTVASFSGITGVTTLVSPNQLNVVIPDLTNYDNEVEVVLKSPLATGPSAKYKVFKQNNKPIITISPTSADINSTITIEGLYFIPGKTELFFVPVTHAITTVISSTKLTAIVPLLTLGLTQLYLQTDLGLINPGQSLFANIIINNGTIPLFESFYPSSASQGGYVDIFGANFDVSTTLVHIGPTQSSKITFIDSGHIRADISNDTPIGDTIIRVDEISKSGFTVYGSTSTLIPTITNINPSVYPGNTVILTGTNLNVPLTITFSGVICKSTPINFNSCSIYIGTDVTPGINSVIVINKYGSSLPYSYNLLTIGNLSLSSFSSTHMKRGQHSIGVYGTGFINSPSMSVYVGNVLSRFSYNSPTALTVQILNSTSTNDTIPTGNVDIRVESINGNYTLNGFTVDTTNQPIISKISPIFGKYGDSIDIYGSLLSGGLISFGTSYPGTYGVTSTIDNSHLKVIVPSGLTTSGMNEIMNVYATTSNGSITYSPFESYIQATSAPSILSFTPMDVTGSTSSKGTLITISGQNFSKYYTDAYISIAPSGNLKYIYLDSQEYISDTEIRGIIPKTLGYIGSSIIKVVTSAGVDQEANLYISKL